MLQGMDDAASHVDVGIHSISGEDLPAIAAAHEFGATIHHPGGQPYIIVDARKHAKRETRAKRSSYMPLPDGKEMVFLKKGKQGMGVTKPHDIIIPARSFIRSTVDHQREAIVREAQRQFGMVLDGNKTMSAALAHAGLFIERAIRGTIRSNVPPTLKPETARRKGSDKTLIDTGTMVNSVRYIVRDKNNRDLRSDI